MAKGIIAMAREEDRRSAKKQKPPLVVSLEGDEAMGSSNGAVDGDGAPIMPARNGTIGADAMEASGSGVARASGNGAMGGPQNGAKGATGNGNDVPNGASNGESNGNTKTAKPGRPKTQLEEWKERMAREAEETAKVVEIIEDEEEDTKREKSMKSENGAIVVEAPPSGPVDVLSSILSSQEQLIEEKKKMVAKPLVVDTKQGKVEVTGKSLASLQYRGQQYTPGDFVYVRPEAGGEAQVHRVERLLEQEGVRSVLGRRFYRGKHETFHAPDRTFYEKEVARSSLHEIWPISRVLGRCYVLPLQHYHSHKVEGMEEKDTYVCEWNYSPRTRQWERMDPGQYWKPPASIKVVPREAPLEDKRMEEEQHQKRKAKPPVTIDTSEERSDVLSSILGNLAKPLQSFPKPPISLPLSVASASSSSSSSLMSSASSLMSSTSPLMSSASSTPKPPSDLLSGLLATQSGLTITKRTLPPTPGVSGQEAASFNSMFSL